MLPKTTVCRTPLCQQRFGVRRIESSDSPVWQFNLVDRRDRINLGGSELDSASSFVEAESAIALGTCLSIRAAWLCRLCRRAWLLPLSGAWHSRVRTPQLVQHVPVVQAEFDVLFL